jgi:hypothetical protein
MIISSILLVTFAFGVGTGSFIEKATGERTSADTSVAGDSTSPSTSPTSIPPQTSAPETPTLAPSAPSTQPGTLTPPTETATRVTIGDQTFFDLDSKRASTDGGSDYEFQLSYGRLLPGTGITIKAVADDQATSFANCDAATNIIVDHVWLHSILEDESLCISTDQGAWATLKVADEGASASSTAFDMQVFAS